MVSRLVTVAALSAVLAGTAAYAQGPGGRGLPGRGPAMGFGGPGLPLRQLDLTEGQQQQVRQLAEQHREQTRTLVERLQKAQEARQDALEAIPVDETRIRAAMQELGEAQTEVAIEHARLQAEIYALLTPGQQQRLQELRRSRRQEIGDRRKEMRRRQNG